MKKLLLPLLAVLCFPFMGPVAANADIFGIGERIRGGIQIGAGIREGVREIEDAFDDGDEDANDDGDEDDVYIDEDGYPQVEDWDDVRKGLHIIYHDGVKFYCIVESSLKSSSISCLNSKYYEIGPVL